MTASKTLSERIQSTAKNLNADASIHSTYGFIDTGILGTNMIKYYYDITHTMESSSVSSAAMYDWLRTPEGILSASLGIIPFAFYSAFANSYYSAETAAGKAFYRSWQAFRDSVKGVKNAFSGTKSSITALKLLATQDYRYLLMPLGLLFGVMSLCNRAWNRNMINKRKDMMDDNKALIKALDEWGSFRRLTALPESNDELKKHAHGFRLIQNSEDETQNGLYYISYNPETEKAERHRLHLNASEINAFLARLKASEDTNPLRPSILQWRNLLPGIAEKHYAAFHQAITEKAKKNHQSKTTQRLAFASQAYAGFIDGLYMFMGLIAITAMSPEILLVVSCVSIFFSAACILTRMHEEKDYQNNLTISQQKTDLALSAKTVEIELAKLLEIKWKLINHEGTLSQQNFHELAAWRNQQIKLNRLQTEADKALKAALGHFNETRDKLYKLHRISTTDAVLVGLRHALAAYTALVCSVFAVALVSLLLFATPLPELVALATVTVGALLLIGSTIYALSMAKTHQANQEKHLRHKNDTIYQFIENKKNKPEAILFQEFPKENTKQKTPSLIELGLDIAMPVYVLMCWTDIFRAFFSGVLKAFKFVFLSLSLLADPEALEHDSTLLWAIAIPAAVLLALTWAIRSLAKYSKDLFGNQSLEATTKPSSANGSDGSAADKGDLGQNASRAHEAATNDQHESIDIDKESEDKTPPPPHGPSEIPSPSSVPDAFFAFPKRRFSSPNGHFIPTAPSSPSSKNAGPVFPNPWERKPRARSEGDDSDPALQQALDNINTQSTTLAAGI